LSWNESRTSCTSASARSCAPVSTFPSTKTTTRDSRRPTPSSGASSTP
jgi:hypothetical protein